MLPPFQRFVNTPSKEIDTPPDLTRYSGGYEVPTSCIVCGLIEVCKPNFRGGHIYGNAVHADDCTIPAAKQFEKRKYVRIKKRNIIRS